MGVAITLGTRISRPTFPYILTSNSHVRTRCSGPSRGATVLTTRAFGSADTSDEDAHHAALQEAVELYAKSEKMARDQVEQELRDLWAAEMATPSDVARACSTPESLAAFWSEQGLPRVQAERLARELIRAHSPCCTLDVLAAQLARLHRVLPVPDLGTTISKDPSILSLTTAQVAERLVTLVDLLDGGDVLEVVARQPRLLTCPDLRGSYLAAVHKLEQLHPANSREVAAAAVRDHPDLLIRMVYHQAARALDDLPLEIQSMLLHSGRGWRRLRRRFSQP